jgi:hypothetical protein
MLIKAVQSVTEATTGAKIAQINNKTTGTIRTSNLGPSNQVTKIVTKTVETLSPKHALIMTSACQASTHATTSQLIVETAQTTTVVTLTTTSPCSLEETHAVASISAMAIRIAAHSSLTRRPLRKRGWSRKCLRCLLHTTVATSLSILGNALTIVTATILETAVASTSVGWTTDAASAKHTPAATLQGTKETALITTIVSPPEADVIVSNTASGMTTAVKLLL